MWPLTVAFDTVVPLSFSLIALFDLITDQIFFFNCYILEIKAFQKENFVIVHGRNIEKCKATIDYIMREGKLPDKSNIDFVVADFSDLKEVNCDIH